MATVLVPTKLVGTDVPINLSEQTTWCSNRKSLVKGGGLLYGVPSKIVGTPNGGFLIGCSHKFVGTDYFL